MKKSNNRSKANKHLRRRELPWYQELLLALVLSGAITFLEVWIQPNSLMNTMYDFVHFPVLLVLNVLPALLLTIACASITGNICTGAAVTELLLCGLSVGNRIKIGYRNEPVWPGDLLLFSEVKDAMEHYSLDYPWLIIAVVLVFALLLALSGLVIKRKRKSRPMKQRLLFRLVALLLSGGMLTALTFTVYASDALYSTDRYPRCNSYRLAAVYCELGTTYSFLHNITAKTVECPTDYSSAEAIAWDTARVDDVSGAQVHVIMVMCEAFSDITDQGVFSFSADDDPLANYHALTRSPNAVSGHLVVSRFGGGTANTEYDVLTGMQSSALSASTSTAFYAVKQNLDSLFRVYGADGYETAFIHPGYDWFYNRENVYHYLGAETSLFMDEMENIRQKGTWATDDYLAEVLEQRFEAATAEGRMTFTYVTTIENHTVYSYDKFGEDYAFPHVNTTVSISDDLQEIADVYVEGLRDTDAMLGALTSYFSRTDEPVVLAFFGDHLPSLGGNIQNYAALGININAEETGTMEYLRSCETPYIIWANDAAVQTLNWNETIEALGLPADGVLSASYLGAVMLELTGRGESTAWFSWLNKVRRQLPVVCGDTVESAAGIITNHLTSEQQEVIRRWQCWSYYKLREKTVE